MFGWSASVKFTCSIILKSSRRATLLSANFAAPVSTVTDGPFQFCTRPKCDVRRSPLVLNQAATLLALFLNFPFTIKFSPDFHMLLQNLLCCHSYSILYVASVPKNENSLLLICCLSLSKRPFPHFRQCCLPAESILI